MDHIAEREITKQGFWAFFPRFIPTGREVAEYLFRGYGFVNFSVTEEQWRCVGHTPGVRRIFGTHPERPTPTRVGTVEALIAKAELTGGVIDERISPPDLTGQTLQLNAGPFSSFQGVCEMSSQDRVRLRLSMFGREVSVAALRSDVEVIG